MSISLDRFTDLALYELQIEGEFAAAHRLREYEGECERLHGHNWRIQLVLEGGKLNSLGMLMDFRDAKRLLGEALEQFDHRDLNELDRFKQVNPTTENVARFICDDLSSRLPEGIRVQSVTAWESPRCGVTYRP